MIERAHAGFDRLLRLAAHIDGARRIFADQHDREPRLDAMLGSQPLHFGRDAARAGPRRLLFRR